MSLFTLHVDVLLGPQKFAEIPEEYDDSFRDDKKYLE